MEAGDEPLARPIAPLEREGVGAMVRARRLELNLSQADVANMVKLPARRIESMEQERWDDLPDGPYLRGFLRNLARALKLDAALLMERVDASLMRSRNPESILVPQQTGHVMLPRRSGPADDRRGGMALVAGAFAFALIAAVIAWSGTNSFDQVVATARGLVAGRSAAPTAGAEPSAATKDVPLAIVGTPQSEAVAPVTAPVALAGPPASTTESAGPSASAAFQLLFHFNEASWVEVRSADGKILLKGLNAAGSEQTVDGDAPFVLVVGNAKGVALRFKGQPVDLTPYTRDQVARLTLS